MSRGWIASRWDTTLGTIAESRLKELHPSMPIMFIKAITQDKQVSLHTFSSTPL